MNSVFYNCYFIFLGTFNVVVKSGGIVVGRLFIWRFSEFVIICGVWKHIKERDFFFINVEFGGKASYKTKRYI